MIIPFIIMVAFLTALAQKVGMLYAFAGFISAAIAFVLFCMLVDFLKEFKYERWARLCHHCGNRKNTFRDNQHVIGYWCRVHGNYLIEKGNFGQ